MEKILYNTITHFQEKVIQDNTIINGYVIKSDFTIEVIKNEVDMTLENMQKLVGGYIEIVRYITDDNYYVVVDEEGIPKQKEFNLLAYTITGFMLYGDVLCIKKDKLDSNWVSSMVKEE